MTSRPLSLTEDPYESILITILSGRNTRQQPLFRESADFAQEEWTDLLSLANREWVTPLLYDILKEQPNVPETFLDACHKAYLATAVANTLRIRETADVVGRLKQAGIDVLALKGLALLEAVYGNIALRPMYDVDLLVRKAQVSDAVQVLEGTGYRVETAEMVPGASLHYGNELFLQKRDRFDWYLELHWTLFDSPYYQNKLPEEALWENFQSIMIGGRSTPSLAPELLLLHLCSHLMLHHQGRGLLWWQDIAELVHQQHDRLNWDLVLSLGQELDLVLSLQSTLPIVAKDWNAPVPEEVLGQLANLQPTAAEMRIFNQMTSEDSPVGRRFLDDFAGFQSWGLRLAYLKDSLFPSAGYMAARYSIRHPALRPFYYPYRWYAGLISFVRGKDQS